MGLWPTTVNEKGCIPAVPLSGMDSRFRGNDRAIGGAGMTAP
jgi:hypothetical protein